MSGRKIAGFTIRRIIYCLSMHYLVSSLVGLLVFLLTSTILLGIDFGGKGVADSSIYLYSFLVALHFAFWSHILEDYTWGKF